MARIFCASPDAVPAGAVWVGAGTMWANPHRVGDTLPSGAVVTPELARSLFAVHVVSCPELAENAQTLLAGMDVACDCALGSPCHGDVLVKAAATAPAPALLVGAEGGAR